MRSPTIQKGLPLLSSRPTCTPPTYGCGASSPPRTGVAQKWRCWGDTAPLDEDVSAVSYRLSAAARAFKAQALLAAGAPTESVAATEALYRCGVTALAPAVN